MRYAEQMTPGSDARDLKGAQLGRRRFRRKSKPVTVTNSEGVEVIRGESSRSMGHRVHDQGCGVHNAGRKQRRCKTRAGQRNQWLSDQ